ncbi:MAG TPA: hypothetical protein VF085_07935 [Solirubrobacterales bacterium]
MSAAHPGRALLAFACLAAALVTAVLWGQPAGAGAEAGSELVAEPAFGAPAAAFLGASPQEAPGEVWATATRGATLARYTDAGGWETLVAPLASGGGPISELEFISGAAAGRTTPRGGVVVAATDAEGQLVVVRDPGGDAHEAPAPGSALVSGESFFGSEDGLVKPLLAAFEASGGHTGTYLAPAASPPSAQEAVLAFDGTAWSREQICVGFLPAPGCTVPGPSFHVLAIDAGGGEAWLLASGAAPDEGLELFRREASGGPGGTPVWRQQSLGPSGSLGALFAQASPSGVGVAARVSGQPLTVSDKGVWVDARLTSGAQKFDATAFYDIGQGEIAGSWCDLSAPAGLCAFPLGSDLPSAGARSFAWPSAGPFGGRTITGVGQGAMLNLEGDVFTRIALAGGNAGADAGAALSAPDEGWLGDEVPLRLTRNPTPALLQAWPVAFRRPLTAVAPAPGAAVGALGTEALAVGVGGQAARYVPGVGWEPEFLLGASGKRATPTLRGVAWPEADEAHAVGDEGEMWIWRKATGLWEPDPGMPSNLVRGNFTAIAFDPADSTRGFAVGKQGLLLRYGRQWTQDPLPQGVPAEANFTSVAFAGDEALVTYKFPVNRNGAPAYTGGVLIEDGSGWRIDDGAQTALSGSVPERVAGLPDGGAAIASDGEGSGQSNAWVIEREAPGAPWTVAPGGPLGYPAALAAVREGGRVRAAVSVAAGQAQEDLGTDVSQVFSRPPAGQPSLLTEPYPLPGAGLVVRQTGTGWRDEQHDAHPLPARTVEQSTYDLSLQPDPILALLMSPDGNEGWAVGGVTGTFVTFGGSASQTAGVYRYGAAAASPANTSTAPLAGTPGMANLAIGGNAQCAAPCADLTGTGIGPDRWLRQAVAGAAGIGGVQAFLYTGSGVAAGEGARLANSTGDPAFRREEAAYAKRLSAAAGALPVFAASSSSDLDRSSSLAAFQAAFSGYGSPLGAAPSGGGVSPLSATGPGKAYYSFASAGQNGVVRVIVLDYSADQLGAGQRCWLAGELANAGAAGNPAIVVGSRDLTGQASNAATDAGLVAPILVGYAPQGCALGSPPAAASAYFFDYPEQNRAFSLVTGGRSVPAYGSGTLGYVSVPRGRETDFVGAGGFLLAAVDVAKRDPATNVAPVGVRLIPNIGSLALDAADGTLLRRSSPALFQALARRPLAGSACRGSNAPTTCEGVFPDPYIPIPAECQGSRCASGLFPEYAFTSSDPDIADFVAHDPSSLNPRSVLLVHDKPVADSSSGLLCAFNSGTTTVTVTAGGLSYSTKVTVQAGTAQRPCGTVPLRHRPAQATAPAAPGAPPAPAPVPSFPPALTPPPPVSVPGPVPLSPPPAPVQPPPPPPPAPVFFTPAPAPTPPVPIVPPPGPPAFQPTPPSGTAPVSQPVEEEEEEVEYDTVQQMVALDHSSRNLPPVYAPALVSLLAIGAAVIAGSGRHRGRRRLAFQNSNTPGRKR